MRLFLSQYTNKIDSKGRVSVPADFRVSLRTQFFNGIIAFRSFKFKTIEALDYERMQKIADSIDDLDFFSVILVVSHLSGIVILYLLPISSVDE